MEIHIRWNEKVLTFSVPIVCLRSKGERIHREDGRRKMESISLPANCLRVLFLSWSKMSVIQTHMITNNTRSASRVGKRKRRVTRTRVNGLFDASNQRMQSRGKRGAKRRKTLIFLAYLFSSHKAVSLLQIRFFAASWLSGRA